MKQKRFVYLGLLIAALLVAACAPKATPTATPQPTATRLRPTDTPKPTATTAVPVPTIIGVKVPMGFTEEGSPYRGNPNASVTLVEYSEFQ